MPYLVIDTETTGLPVWRLPADGPGQPRVASLAMLAVDDDLEIEERFYELVQPAGWEMPAAAQAINGLSQEKLLAHGMPIDSVLHAFLGRADGRTLVAHNLDFDLKMMRGELRRASLPSDAYRSGICTMRGLTGVCGIPGTSGYKWPSLNEACSILLRREIVGAHNAIVDAKACLWLLRAMSERGLLTKAAAA